MEQNKHTPSKKQARLPYPAHVPKDIRDRAKKYADTVTNKETEPGKYFRRQVGEA